VRELGLVFGVGLRMEVSAGSSAHCEMAMSKKDRSWRFDSSGLHMSEEYLECVG